MKLTKEIEDLLTIYQNPNNSSKERQHYSEKIMAIILKQKEDKNKV